MGNKNHLAPTPHTSNVHGSHRQSHETNSKVTNVLFLGPFTAKEHGKYIASSQDNGQSELKRVQSAPCLGSHDASAHHIDSNASMISGSSSRIGLLNHVIIMCTLLVLFFALMHWLTSSYKSTVMIALLLFLVEQKFCSLLGEHLLIASYLPGANAEPQQKTVDETMHCKLCHAMGLSALNNFILNCFFLHCLSQQRYRSFS